MLSMMSMYDQNRSDHCVLCHKILSDIKAYPNVCDHYFHYKCLRNYVDNRLDKCESIICPICSKIFNQIANKFKKSKDILFQNVILSNDETQCCICFSKYKTPIASTDSCSHSFCFECLKKWCTFKHECPMDRMPIKLLLLSDFPGGHITKKEAPPPIEQDLNGDGDNDEILNTTCEICNLGNNDHQLLLCDNCNRGYHIYCLSDPLSEIPEGDWFCEECSNDMGISNQILPRGIRGLQHVIDNLQNRYTNNQQNHQNVNTRATRGRRNRTRAQDVSSDESDSSYESLPRSRTRGVRRSRRNRVVYSDVASTISDNVHLTRQDEIPVVSGSNDELLSRSRRRVIVESEASEEDQETDVVENEYLRNAAVSVTYNEGSSSSKGETAVNSRNRQGSLSSEAESEMDPTRRKTEESESYKESSTPTSDDESVTSLQRTTRKRGRTRNQNSIEVEEDSPLPRPIKRPRMIDESSEYSSDESNESLVVGNPKKRKIIESSDSNDSASELDENYTNSNEEEERKRNFSTSSSLSTIPCRVPLAGTSRASSSTAVPTRYRTRKYPLSNSTESDFEKSYEAVLSKPSTSQRRSTIKRGKVKKRRTTSKKTPKKSSKRKIKSTRKSKTTRGKRRISTTPARQSAKNFDIGTSMTLSLFGREKQLPVVTDEELNIKRVTTTASRPNTSSNSILSEINEAQTNFRHISLSTVVRLSDGTLIHKARTEPNDSSENKDPKRIHNVPSTSSSQPQSSSSVSTTAHHQQPVSQQKPTPVRPKPPVQIVHPMTESILIPKPEPRVPIPSSTNNTVSNSGRSAVETKQSSSAHVTKIKNTIKKCVNTYYERGDINADENKTLSARITEKIMKRHNQSKTPGDQSIKDFSKKYLKFYLSKRK